MAEWNSFADVEAVRRDGRLTADDFEPVALESGEPSCQ